MTDSNPSSDMSRLRPETLAISVGRPTEAGSPLNVGLTPASNFISDTDPGQQKGSPYARGAGTDSWRAFEAAIGALEGGQALSFASGMGAMSAVFGTIAPNARLLVPDDIYHGVGELIAEGEARLGWQVLRLPGRDTERWISALGSADFVWVESPSNPLLEIADVPAICAAAAKANVTCGVDNTFATPLLQRPLDHGATFVVHSSTKFIGGHSDLLSGVVMTALGTEGDEAMAKIQQRRLVNGATPGTLESFLALRGLRTLPLRLERSQSNAMELADRLAGHRTVTKVRYPGLEGHPGYELAQRIMAGPGAVLSFETVGNAISADIRLARLKLLHVATSLGGVETTIERRSKTSGQSHLPETLMRISVGCEHIEDIWEDLDRVLTGVI